MGMAKVKGPKYVNAFIDRHGRVRHYLRLPGQKAVPLPGMMYSPEMMRAYTAIMASQPLPIPAQAIGASRTKPER